MPHGFAVSAAHAAIFIHMFTPPATRRAYYADYGELFIMPPTFVFFSVIMATLTYACHTAASLRLLIFIFRSFRRHAVFVTAADLNYRRDAACHYRCCLRYGFFDIRCRLMPPYDAAAYRFIIRRHASCFSAMFYLLLCYENCCLLSCDAKDAARRANARMRSSAQADSVCHAMPCCFTRYYIHVRRHTRRRVDYGVTGVWRAIFILSAPA